MNAVTDGSDFAAKTASNDESIPPDNNIDTGTSLTSLLAIAFF